MMTFLKWIFYLVAAVAIIIVGGSFLLPAQAVVTRSVEIAAPPNKVFAIVERHAALQRVFAVGRA